MAGTSGNPEMTVALAQITGRDTGNGLAINGVAASAVAVLIRPTGSGTCQVYVALSSTGRSSAAGSTRRAGASRLPSMSGRGGFTIPGMIGGSVEYWDRAQLRFG